MSAAEACNTPGQLKGDPHLSGVSLTLSLGDEQLG